MEEAPPLWFAVTRPCPIVIISTASAQRPSFFKTVIQNTLLGEVLDVIREDHLKTQAYIYKNTIATLSPPK